MPTRATWLASTPKCDHLRGGFGHRIPCDLLLRWVSLSDGDGIWCCKLHGPMMSGMDAAMRAGYISVVHSEAA